MKKSLCVHMTLHIHSLVSHLRLKADLPGYLNHGTRYESMKPVQDRFLAQDMKPHDSHQPHQFMYSRNDNFDGDSQLPAG
jgi:hypothetical protein